MQKNGFEVDANNIVERDSNRIGIRGLVRTSYWTQIRDIEKDKWVVPFKFSDSFSDFAKGRVRTALRQLESEICILFKEEMYPVGNYINIIDDGGCYSQLGMVGGAQLLSLSQSYCMSNGVIQHEFLHSLGLHHEQVRPDRDNYVEVLLIK